MEMSSNSEPAEPGTKAANVHRTGFGPAVTADNQAHTCAHALQVVAAFDAAEIRLIEILNDRAYSADDPQPQEIVWERMRVSPATVSCGNNPTPGMNARPMFADRPPDRVGCCSRLNARLASATGTLPHLRP